MMITESSYFEGKTFHLKEMICNTSYRRYLCLQETKTRINSYFKGRFLLFQVYSNFANFFSKLSVSTFYKVISKFQHKSAELKELD